MRTRSIHHIILPLLLGLALGWAEAFAEPVVGPPADPATLCMAAVGFAEQTEALPHGLLGAMAKVESGRPDAAARGIAPWPWTIDANGQGHFYATKQDAIAAARAFRRAGINSLDVGCLQINLQQHPHAFASLEAAFSPPMNALYAAQFLRRLKTQTGGWKPAIAAYHSETPSLGLPYQQRVLAVWEGGEPQVAFSMAPPMPKPLFSRKPVGKIVTPVPNPPRHPPPARYGAGSFQFSALRGQSVIVPAVTASAGLPGTMTGRGLAAYRAMPILINGARKG